MKKVTQEEWEQLLKQNPTNDDLIYIIEYTDKKNEAQSILYNLQETPKSIIEIIKSR